MEMNEKKNPTEGIICNQDAVKHKLSCLDCPYIVLRIKRLKSDHQWKCTMLTRNNWGSLEHLGTTDCTLELVSSEIGKWKLKSIKDDEIVGMINKAKNEYNENEATFKVRWDYKDRPSEVKSLYMNCHEVELKEKGDEVWTAFE